MSKTKCRLYLQLLVSNDTKMYKLKPETRVLCIVLLLTIVSCSSSKKKKVDSQWVPAEDSALLTKNYVRLCYGIETEADTSNFMEHAMQLLNASDYSGCLALFKTNFGVIRLFYFVTACRILFRDKNYYPKTMLS